VRIVIDTNVLISGIRSRSGASAALLRLAAHGKVTHLLNVALAFEYEEKCTEARLALASGMSIDEIMEIVDNIIGTAKKVQNHYFWRPMLRDPDDEMVLEAAINGGADAIVTFNSKDFGNVPASMNIEILSPAQVLKEILK
jgi:putative PIN family toxin of toxin-antitoxin system